MSKRRRRRLKKLAKVLGAGLAIAGLGRTFSNRNKASGANVDSGRGGDSASAAARVLANTPEENTFKVQEVKIETPKKKPLSVQPEVISRNTGIMIDEKGNKVPALKNNKQPYLNRMADKRRVDALRAIRSSPDIATTPDSIIEGVPLPDYMISARKGGRIVKGKKTAVRTGAAKRGFGRAFKGGK